MHRAVLLALVTLLAIGIVIAAGCSSDKSTNNQDAQRDPASAAFVESSVARSLADGAGQSLIQTLELFDFPVTAPNRPSVGSGQAADSSIFDSVIYTYTGGNHIFHFVASVTETVGTDSFVTTTIRGDDTVTLWNNNVAQPDRDTTTDSIRARLMVTLDLAGPGFNISTTRHHRVQVGGNPWTDSSLEVDGNLVDSADLAFSNDSGSCTLSLHSLGNAFNVVLDSNSIYNDGCPESGNINFSTALALACEGNGGLTHLNVNGAWAISVSWDGVVQTTKLTHNFIDYTSTDTCGSGGVGKLNPWAIGGR